MTSPLIIPRRSSLKFGKDGEAMPSPIRRGSLSTRRNSGSAVAGRLSTTPGWFSTSKDPEETQKAVKQDIAEHLRKLENTFAVTPQRMRMIVDAFIDTLEKGLAENGQMVPMIPTWVFGWPAGSETGKYLAVDLGGTNLRVCQVTLEGEGKFEITQAKYRLTEEQKQEEGQKLFDFCAECLASFIQDQYGDENGDLKLDGDLPLGFTFSYPVIQDRIDHGVLLRWTKGFGNPNVEGNDVVEMFKKSLSKYELPIKLSAIINDTTGTLIASHYVDPLTKIGVIFGTGCNAA
ncbi:hypothetical protein BT69DRAFT_1311216 [Atractiella rhizophila]|nr:hypothetical protein BT69DRAFT_1311216 [Atractiella rhizophila]